MEQYFLNVIRTLIVNGYSVDLTPHGNTVSWRFFESSVTAIVTGRGIRAEFGMGDKVGILDGRIFAEAECRGGDASMRLRSMPIPRNAREPSKMLVMLMDTAA